MNLLIVPARNDLPWYKFKVNMSGVIYTLRFRYNVRMQRWILDLADAGNADIINGMPLLVERDLKGRFVVSGLPDGALFVTDDTNSNVQPTRYSFGVNTTLFYEDPDGTPPSGAVVE